MEKKSGKFRKKHVSYAQVSNIALRDERLSLKSKGLLALIESYLSLDNFVLYKNFLLKKSKDGECSFRGAWNELKQYGYLVQYKLRDEDTKQYYYEYEICDYPDTKKPHVDFPHVDNLPHGFPTCGFSTSGKPPLFNNNIDINSIKINDIHNIPTNNLLIAVRMNVEYDIVFKESEDKELVDNIVDIMVELLNSKNKWITIGGNQVDAECVKSVLMRVRAAHIDYAVRTIKSYTEPIKNVKGFIISVVYNSVLTLDAYFTNLYNQNEV